MRAIVATELESIRDLGVAPTADGAFYFFLRIKSTMPPMQLVERLVREHGVAVIPGDAFGETSGCSLRISYGALTAESAREGVRRFTQGLRKILARVKGCPQLDRTPAMLSCSATWLSS